MEAVDTVRTSVPLYQTVHNRCHVNVRFHVCHFVRKIRACGRINHSL
jgi:hypothetical protein